VRAREQPYASASVLLCSSLLLLHAVLAVLVLTPARVQGAGQPRSARVRGVRVGQPGAEQCGGGKGARAQPRPGAQPRGAHGRRADAHARWADAATQRKAVLSDEEIDAMLNDVATYRNA